MDTRLRINAERERGKLIVTGRVFNPTNAAPPYLCAVRQWHSPRLLDHETWYRLDGARGPAGRTNTVVVTEPYLADAHVPAALSEWALALAKHSLTIRQLGRDLLLHAPVNPASQIFLIGPPALIG
jgi:hypothetical protein